jgi:hypothetical protein
MSRTWLILALAGVSLGVSACGDYEEQGYDENNAAYDEAGNDAYDAAENEAYDASGNNAAYTPPPDANLSTNNLVGEAPPDNSTMNRY